MMIGLLGAHDHAQAQTQVQAQVQCNVPDVQVFGGTRTPSKDSMTHASWTHRRGVVDVLEVDMSRTRL